MNEPRKSNNVTDISGTSSPQRSPRKSPLSSPRASPRSFAEKRALFGKMKQHRLMQQQKLKAEEEAGRKDTAVEPVEGLDGAMKEGDSTPFSDEFNPFPPNSNASNATQLETISNQNIFIPNHPQCTDSNNVMRAQSEEEFSEVFTGSQMKTVNDLTKRVLDKSFVLQQNQQSVSDNVGGADSFDRDGEFMTDSPRDRMFDCVDSFDRGSLNSPGDAHGDVDVLTDKLDNVDIANYSDRDMEGGAAANDVITSMDSFKSCRSTEEIDIPAEHFGASESRHEEQDQLNAENIESELSNRSIDSSVSDISDGPKASHIDVRLKRKQKMASRVASGKYKMPKSFLSTAATSANKVAELENDAQIVVDKGSPLPVESTIQQEPIDAPLETGVDDLNVSYHIYGDLSADSTDTGAADGPRASPIDPKLRRRHKMASRVASGKVNVPKSFLSAAATSANKVADLENGERITMTNNDTKKPPGNTPMQTSGFDMNEDVAVESNIALLASIHSGLDKSEEATKPYITAVTTEQSVELHASLNEVLNLSRDSGCPPAQHEEALSTNTSATPSHESSPEGEIAILDTSVDSNKGLDKNEARRQRRHLRKRDVSIVKSSDEEKSSKDLLGDATSVDGDEAKKLFPMPSLDDKNIVVVSVNAQEPMSPLDCPSVQLETAWDQNATTNLDTILEQSKSRNTNNQDGKPLLELDAATSDAALNDGRMAAEKLMSQKERMTMYTSGKGFGVGDDSSVELPESDNEADENFEEPNEYQTVEEENDDVDAACSEQDTDTFDFIEFGKGSHEEFSAAASSAMHGTTRVFDQNSDATSDIDRRSDYFSDANSSITGGGTVLGIRFIKSNDDSLRTRPTPPGSPAPSSKKLFKIAPPPPEKLQKWEYSKFDPSAFKSPMNRGVSTPKQQIHPMTPKSTPPSVEKTPSLKISTPKSPSKKKPHSITEELNLSNQTKMAEKFARASVKAAKRFEEEYSHIEHDINYGPQSKSPERKGGKAGEASRSRFFCAGDASIPFIPSSNTNETEGSHQLNSVVATTVGPGGAELVGGAFSPWKIPDRAEEDSNASSSRITGVYDDESYAKASAAALNAIRVKSELRSNILSSDNDPASVESFEVDWTNGDASSGGIEQKSLLSDILLWLFNDILPSNAFSAFDIDNTSSSVLARRVLAIANDDKSLNQICRHVTSVVSNQQGNMIGSPEKKGGFATEISNVCSSGDQSSSSCESSQVSSIASSSISDSKSSFSERAAARILKGKKHLEPFLIPTSTNGDARPPGEVLAANFISFLQQISQLTGVPLPIDDNPFLQSVVNLTTKKCDSRQERKNMQQLVFDSDEKIVAIFTFLKRACGDESKKPLMSIVETADEDENIIQASHNSPLEWKESLSGDAVALEARLASGSQTLKRSNKRKPNSAVRGSISQSKESSQRRTNMNLVVPKTSPSPFETAVWNDPSIMLSILSFLGNPVSVCVVKRLNVFCNRLVSENEHVLMRDAVRLGGMSKFVRPSFWLWVTMERCAAEDPIALPPSRREHSFSFGSDAVKQRRDFVALKDAGAAGKWQHIIERDVLRSFGNMPPHKTGAKYRQDSIVRALVSFGREEIMRNSRSYQAMDKLPEESEARHFKLSSRLDRRTDGESDDNSETPTDTVSDWGAISPVGSMISEEPSAATSEDAPTTNDEVAELLEVKPRQQQPKLTSVQIPKSDVCDPVLSGNALTNEMKVDLQNKLRSILHALAAQHEGLGYCQGMDYVVAHLLRVLQDTILLRVVQGSITMPGDENRTTFDWKAMPAEQLRCKMNEINSETNVVDEVVFRVMDTLFTTYNLQHMYWPELRCLKTCCRVFESLIKQKLPVLADHFEHHDLNVGLFALGWFQTLFLYLPSMPSATVCHMWDIWLVERSFKIFFRVGTAILFLSQPTLLNHDLEGMMTYLNTFPDATLLRRDILIPCALQIKITNSMLVEIEMDVTNFGKSNEAGVEQYSVY